MQLTEEQFMYFLKLIIKESLSNITFLKKVLKTNTAKELIMTEEIYQKCLKNIEEVEDILKSIKKNPNQKDMDKKLSKITTMTKYVVDKIVTDDSYKKYLN